MSRSRNIKPGFFRNEVLVELPFEYRLLYIGTWTHADREGRFEDRPLKIKMELFPADNIDVDAGLHALQEKGFLLRYSVGGAGYCQIIAWAKHQNPHHREQPSLIPAPVKPEACPRLEADKPDTSRADSLFSDSLSSDSLIPERAARAGESQQSRLVLVTDGNGNPSNTSNSLIANLTAEQSAVVVLSCKALRKMGAIRFNSGDEGLAALATEGFTAEQIARTAGEKALRDAGMWNDPDVHPDLLDLLINGASQEEMRLTPAQHTALRAAVSQVSIGYIASTLRGRRRDAQAKPSNNRGNGRTNEKPKANDDFEGKEYTSTPIDQMPALFRDAVKQVMGDANAA
jgi:hypothetical protein